MNIKAKLIRDPDVTMATQSTPQFTNKAFELQQVSTGFEYGQLKKLKINKAMGLVFHHDYSVMERELLLVVIPLPRG